MKRWKDLPRLKAFEFPYVLLFAPMYTATLFSSLLVLVFDAYGPGIFQVAWSFGFANVIYGIKTDTFNPDHWPTVKPLFALSAKLALDVGATQSQNERRLAAAGWGLLGGMSAGNLYYYFNMLIEATFFPEHYWRVFAAASVLVWLAATRRLLRST